MPTTTTSSQQQTDEQRQRNQEKELLIRQITILGARKDALEALIEQRRAALKLLMSGDGDRKRSCGDGDAEFETRRSFQVCDTKALMRLFSKETLAENFKPTAAFVDAAIKAGKDIESAVLIGYDERFKVVPPKSAAARKQREELIERAKAEAEAKVEQLTAKIQRQTDPSNDKE